MEKKQKFQKWILRRSEKISSPDDRQRKKAVFFCLLAAIPLLYVSGFLAQLLDHYALWREMGGVPGDGTSPAFPDKGFLKCIVSVFSFSGLKVFSGIIAGIGLLMLMLWLRDKEDSRAYDNERNFHYSEKGTYGTAGYMEPEKMRAFLDVTSIQKTKGTILGTVGRDIVSIPLDSRMNKNIAVFGASGSMKSRAFVRNMIFQSVIRGESMVLTDPKSELYEDMSAYLEEQGYLVKVFNLVQPAHSDQWNCIGEIDHDQMMAQICADVIIKNTSSGKIDHFWDTSELNLLKALLLYVDHEKAVEDRNMGEVYEILRMPMDEALVILRGQKVFKVKKFDYTRHPESKKLKKRKAVDYSPIWRQDRQAEQISSEPKEISVPKAVKKQEEQRKKVFTQIPKNELMRRKKEE